MSGFRKLGHIFNVVTDCLKSLFDIAFCDPEDPNRAKQEATYVYFADFLDECEGTYKF